MPPLRTLVALCVTLTACRLGYRTKLSAELQQALAAGPADRKLRVLVDLSAQLDLSALSDSLAHRALGRAQRRWLVVTALSDVARERQSALGPLLEQLRRDGAIESYRGFVIVNRLLVVGTARAITALARRPDVAAIDIQSAPQVSVLAARTAEAGAPPVSPSWAVRAVGADRAWRRGLAGRGVVVGIIDAGASAAHEQLRGNYRGGDDSWHDPTGQSAAPANSAVSVGAIAQSDTLVSSSSRGPNRCDGAIFPTLVAPGEDIPAAFPLTPSTYIRGRGTSIAAAFVAGAAAILLERHPDATVADVEYALRAAARDLGPPGPDNQFGYGVLDVPAALDSLGRFLARKGAPDSTSAPTTHK